MSDLFHKHTPGLESPASHIMEITPNDGSDLTMASRAINVAQSGLVQITTVSGSTAAIYVAAGVAFPVRATRIWSSGTTASGITVLS
jgi:hypothetical protein